MIKCTGQTHDLRQSHNIIIPRCPQDKKASVQHQILQKRPRWKILVVFHITCTFQRWMNKVHSSFGKATCKLEILCYERNDAKVFVFFKTPSCFFTSRLSLGGKCCMLWLQQENRHFLCRGWCSKRAQIGQEVRCDKRKAWIWSEFEVNLSLNGYWTCQQ